MVGQGVHYEKSPSCLFISTPDWTDPASYLLYSNLLVTQDEHVREQRNLITMGLNAAIANVLRTGRMPRSRSESYTEPRCDPPASLVLCT